MAKKLPPESLPVGRTMRAAHLAAQCTPNTEIVKAGELVEARFARGASPSAPARKALALMIQAAAGDGWKSGPHSILKRELRAGHQSNDRLPAVLDELQTTLLRIERIAPDGRAAVLVAPVIAYRIEHLEDDDTSRVWWEFSEAARLAMQGSDYFAAINRGTLLSFESRYAVTLYELGCLLYGRRDSRWRGTVDELRAVMGVPGGKYSKWKDVKVRAIESAMAEVNAVAPFMVSCQAEHGPHNKVLAVELWFLPKAPAAAVDINPPRVGRKARRGTVETVQRAPPPELPTPPAPPVSRAAEILAELDARHAGKDEYRVAFSTFSKERLRRGETWRSRLVAYVAGETAAAA